MHPENIDDLFRGKLDGHETPPGDALWARLQAQPAAELPAPTPAEAAESRLDHLFRQGLQAHATPPGRALWERLEDEHLRPRKRRSAAWWPLALVAAVALLLVAGGAGLWLGFPAGKTDTGTVAVRNGKRAPKATTNAGQRAAPALPGQDSGSETRQAAADASATVAVNTPAGASETTVAAPIQKNIASQATPSPAVASSAPKARMSNPGPSPRHEQGTSRRPDAAPGAPHLVARTTPAVVAPRSPVSAADERQAPVAPAVVAAVAPQPAPSAEIVPAPLVPAANLAAGELITVDVRNGASAARPAKTISVAIAQAEAPAEPRRLGSRLLQQAGHLVRGERVSLAAAAGLPENVTLRATVAGHSVSKSIRL